MFTFGIFVFATASVVVDGTLWRQGAGVATQITCLLAGATSILSATALVQ